MRLRLLLREITDTYARKNFEFIQRFFLTEAILGCDFRHYTFEFTEAGTNVRLKHSFGYIPTDVLQSFLTGTGVLTWNYDLFDKDFLDVTVTGPCKVKAFIGSYGALR